MRTIKHTLKSVLLVAAMAMTASASAQVLSTKTPIDTTKGAIASVTAQSQIPQPTQAGKFSVGVGAGRYDHTTGLALGGAYRTQDDRVVLKAGVSKALGNSASTTTTVGVGAAYQF